MLSSIAEVSLVFKQFIIIMALGPCLCLNLPVSVTKNSQFMTIFHAYGKILTKETNVTSAPVSWALIKYSGMTSLESSFLLSTCGCGVAWWLMHLSLDQAVWVQALAGDIVVCSQTIHLTVTVPLSTHVYKWVLANVMLGVTLLTVQTSIPSREEQKYSLLMLHATETRICSHLMSHMTRMLTLHTL